MVPAAELAQTTNDWAKRLARGPAFAFAKTKEMLNREMDMDLLAALDALLDAWLDDFEALLAATICAPSYAKT